MKTWLRVLFTLLSLVVLLFPRLASAQASDGGADAGCVDYAGNPCPPLACDGALCDTTNGSGCSASGGAGSPTMLLTVLGAVALAIARRRRRRALEQTR